MGFLEWFKASGEKDKEADGSQLSLFNDSDKELTAKRKRVDGATVRRDYTDTIKHKGGDSKGIRRATEAITQEVTGHGVEELYEQTGAKRGDRSTLPKEAQKALMTGEIVANNDLKETTVQGNQQQRNEKIINAAKKSGKKVRKLFPW